MSKSSSRWLQEHHRDPYVQQAKRDGYRSRAAYKLLEIQTKDALIQPGMTIVDLGAAPGGWSQVASDLTGEKGRVVAIDLLDMDPVPFVTFIQHDFTDSASWQKIKDALDSRPVDCILSDMAPNLTGHKVIDQLKSAGLVEDAIGFALQNLKTGGHFLAKIFQGTGFDDCKKLLQTHFKKVTIRKPDSSRDRSAEIYLLAQHFKGQG
jgi:23S rRNA (uridine2552-2'-O)-methyltransferase